MIFKYLKKQSYIDLSIIILIFFLDRISKIYILILNEKNLDGDLFNSQFLNISLTWNSGIAFGLLSFKQEYLYNVITGLIFLVIFYLIILAFKAKKLRKYSYLLIVGGGLGNLFDRILYRSVPDFIDFYYNGFHWFIFNIADIFITIGVICLIYDEVFIEKNRNE